MINHTELEALYLKQGLPAIITKVMTAAGKLDEIFLANPELAPSWHEASQRRSA